MRPCFVIDERFKNNLANFNNKEELIKPKSQSNIYQKGFKMTYCNPIPIAASCYLPKNVIIDTLAAIFNATLDMINLGKNVSIKTGFCNICFFDSNMSYTFNPELGKIVENIVESESKVINSLLQFIINYYIIFVLYLINILLFLFLFLL
jgi:hypothetical protein